MNNQEPVQPVANIGNLSIAPLIKYKYFIYIIAVVLILVGLLWKRIDTLAFRYSLTMDEVLQHITITLDVTQDIKEGGILFERMIHRDRIQKGRELAEKAKKEADERRKAEEKAEQERLQAEREYAKKQMEEKIQKKVDAIRERNRKLQTNQ